MKLRSITTLLIAVTALWACATAQNDDKTGTKPSVAGACLDAKQLKARDLYGDWRARFDGAVDSGEADVTFEPHKETEGALSGRIVRPATAKHRGTTSVLAGGIADGEFGIEESDDGERISGLWNGSVVPQSCGREIRGTWIDPADDSERGFVLQRKNNSGD